MINIENKEVETLEELADLLKTLVKFQESPEQKGKIPEIEINNFDEFDKAANGFKALGVFGKSLSKTVGDFVKAVEDANFTEGSLAEKLKNLDEAFIDSSQSLIESYQAATSNLEELSLKETIKREIYDTKTLQRSMDFIVLDGDTGRQIPEKVQWCNVETGEYMATNAKGEAELKQGNICVLHHPLKSKGVFYGVIDRKNDN